MAAISRRRDSADYTWPGYVDALTTLLMVLIFLLSIFSVAQFSLSTVLSNKDTAIDTLSKQIGSLADQLNLEKQNSAKLQKDLQAVFAPAVRPERHQPRLFPDPKLHQVVNVFELAH